MTFECKVQFQSLTYASWVAAAGPKSAEIVLRERRGWRPPGPKSAEIVLRERGWRPPAPRVLIRAARSRAPPQCLATGVGPWQRILGGSSVGAAAVGGALSLDNPLE